MSDEQVENLENSVRSINEVCVKRVKDLQARVRELEDELHYARGYKADADVQCKLTYLLNNEMALFLECVFVTHDAHTFWNAVENAYEELERDGK